MEEDKGVKVGVIRGKVLGSVEGVEVFDVGGDLHGTAETVLYDGAKGVGRGACGQRELGVAVGHALRADEVEVKGGAGEEMGELEPDFAGEGGFGAGAEDEEAHGRRVGTKAFDVDACAGARRVEGVSKGWE